MLTVRHRCRALLVAKDAELRRAHEQLQLVQAEARDAAAAAAARGVRRRRRARDRRRRRSPSPPATAGRAPDQLRRGAAARAGAAAARHEAEVERWKSRATSLEARLKGAAEARRAWQLEQAELLERVDAQARQLALSDHAAQPVQIGYLKNTLLKYFEMGPDAFDEVFPLLSGFLEFSPEELERIRAARAAQQGSRGWLLGGASAPLPAAPPPATPAAATPAVATPAVAPPAAPPSAARAPPPTSRAAPARRAIARRWRGSRSCSRPPTPASPRPRRSCATAPPSSTGCDPVRAARGGTWRWRRFSLSCTIVSLLPIVL